MEFIFMVSKEDKVASFKEPRNEISDFERIKI